MNTEERKEYNKNYYCEKRDIILKKLCAQATCELCGRKVKYCNMVKHKATVLCSNNRKPLPEGITALQYEKLKKELREEIIKELN